ncbi:NAD(P)-binding domain [Phaffia rhodozyma]|uniref:NAD(P)-binding domain n=1 Tax=Phaffia rhodozyma TaxID=264483 RepID=A0A0F7SGI3_PHARH|nr:NAD(P)-binding domain [Phaffia rhodozyma]
METGAAKRFFTAKYYAVAGANSEPKRFGHKIFVWYLSRSLPVTPISPHPEIKTTFPTSPHKTLASVSQLTFPKETSLSIVTPPAVTLSILKEAQSVGIHSVFLQPGTYDEPVMNLLKSDEWWTGRWTGPGVEGKRGEGGWCVLVDGDDLLATLRKDEETKGKL